MFGKNNNFSESNFVDFGKPQVLTELSKPHVIDHAVQQLYKELGVQELPSGMVQYYLETLESQVTIDDGGEEAQPGFFNSTGQIDVGNGEILPLFNDIHFPLEPQKTSQILNRCIERSIRLVKPLFRVYEQEAEQRAKDLVTLGMYRTIVPELSGLSEEEFEAKHGEVMGVKLMKE